MDERFISYLYCFNVTHDYFECHEYLEALWLESGRPVVLKGLIQAAVCLYHLENGNVRGGHRMWARAKSYLTPSLPAYEGIDLVLLFADIDGVFEQVPRAWYDQVVGASEIASLNLPRVTLSLTNANLAAGLANWTLSPLDSD